VARPLQTLAGLRGPRPNQPPGGDPPVPRLRRFHHCAARFGRTRNHRGALDGTPVIEKYPGARAEMVAALDQLQLALPDPGGLPLRPPQEIDGRRLVL
jgi:hypothetical protein